MIKPKTIDEVCLQPKGSFNKHLEMDKIISRAGGLWRRINIYTARKPLSERVQDFRCPKCEDGLLKINWNKMGMSYSCLDKDCNFEYPN